MSRFLKKKMGGSADVIRCDETNYLVWKWHPNGAEPGTLKRETAIRTTSVLRVKDGEVAVFVYKQKDGTMQDFIVGPYDETIKTKNFPILSSIIGLWYEGDTPFQAEVFFINLAKVIQIKFGVPYFDVADPRFPDFAVPVAARGTLTFQIEDYKQFIKCHQLINFDLDTLKAQVTDTIIQVVKGCVANAPASNNIPLIQIETKIGLVNESAELSLKDKLSDVFGVEVKSLDISAFELDKESDGYLELKKITKDITSREMEANVKDYEERLRIKREEDQYAQHMGTRTTNLGAYETEARSKVGIAGAEALGKMGEKGTGNINLGNGGAGFNPMTIMAGLAVGSAVGKNISDALNSSMESGKNVTPPPVPHDKYFVAAGNNPSGPFDKATIISMINNGQIKKDTLLWKQGTPAWEKAMMFDEISPFFLPDIPNE